MPIVYLLRHQTVLIESPVRPAGHDLRYMATDPSKKGRVRGDP